MKPVRKITRFYIINPNPDRRIELRFESRESVAVRRLDDGRVVPASASDVGQYGLRLLLIADLEVGQSVEVSFHHTTDHIRCFGRVVWVRPVPTSLDEVDVGVCVDAWHGIIAGGNSWLSIKGRIPRKDRRSKRR